MAPQANMATSVLNTLSQMTTTLEQTDLMQKIERGIQRFAGYMPWLMKALDELARIHPVVTGS